MSAVLDLHHPDIMNAIPVPIFLVDDDVRILDLNAAASGVFGLVKQAVHGLRGGDALHCLHAHDVPEGCGRGPACKLCVIRNSVTTSVKGARTNRRRAAGVLAEGRNLGPPRVEACGQSLLP